MSESKNNIRLLLEALTPGYQSLEAALQQLLANRSVDTAVGAQLDVIGRIVGLPRSGLSDETYRRFVRAKIVTNFSKGRVEDLIKVCDLIVYEDAASYEVTTHPIATVVVRVLDVAISAELSDVLVKFLRLAKSAGVRLILEYSDKPLANWFQWDVAGRGWDQAFFTDAKS